MDSGPRIVHVMHSYYGKANLPGGRSQRIAEDRRRTRPVRVFSLLNRGRLRPGEGIVVHRSIRGPLARAIRFVAVRVLPMGPKRRFALRQFDAATARSVSKLPPGSVGILHIWNWVPKTVAAIRRLNPDAVVLRDVSIAREYDFELGEHITTEMKHVDLFVSPSRFATEQMLQWGVPESRIKEIPFGVDLEMFRPDGERPRNEARNVRYAYAGAVSARKGIPELLRAWQILDLEDAELHLYGTVKAEVRPYLEGASHVVAHGFTRIAEELPKNDVFVFPSHREGSSKAVYEALACGLPVITTPNAGSVVRDGVEGYVVPPGDEVALADAVRRLHEDGRKRVVMGRAARSRAEEFPWSRYARDVWALYEQTTMHQGES